MSKMSFTQMATLLKNQRNIVNNLPCEEFIYFQSIQSTETYLKEHSNTSNLKFECL